jgi:hypothetical protein
VTYRPKPVTQRDGSKLQNSNCLMATAATGLDYHTLGKKTSTGSKMRQLSGDTSGGTNSDEIARAWKRGYDETASIRDGQPWSAVRDALDNGRLVMLQVWASTVGSPLCCTTNVGHGISVNPETRVTSGVRQWLVADPWCKPPKWVWVDEARLRKGAEVWADKMGAAGVMFHVPVPTPEEPPTEAWHALVYAMYEYLGDPTHPVEDDPFDGATGPTNGVLFALTKIQKDQPTPPPEEITDVSVNTSANAPVTGDREAKLLKGTDLFDDAGLTQKLGDLSSERWVPIIGSANGQPGRAVIVNTGYPYSDKEARPTLLYVKEADLKDFRAVTPPTPPDEEVIAKRDAEWRAWLDSKSADAPDK